MADYSSREQYESDLDARGLLPPGFRITTAALSFVPEEKQSSKPLAMNLALVLPETPTALFAATFTQNAFPGWPVLLGRERLEQPVLNGVLINNRIANVNTQGGRRDIERLTDELGALTSRSPAGFLTSSTGVIGWRLPVDEISRTLPALAGADTHSTALPLARAIMTTDSYPKVRGKVTASGSRIVGVAKGAGMIEPNMATLLVFLFTDALLSREALRDLLPGVIGTTFNRISIDSDQSTSDTALLMSSGLVETAREEFCDGLTEVCDALARDVVRNGEGTEHVLAVTVEGGPPGEHALGMARAVINSPLVKTAIAGNDPNVGRILMALGDYCGNHGVPIDSGSLTFSIGGVTVYQDGLFVLDDERESRIAGYLAECAQRPKELGYPSHERTVDILIRIGRGETRACVYGSDLTHGYVTENADYRS
jgi:glutamate N-acetyltransferase/amino-acid N-acetyltransferase